METILTTGGLGFIGSHTCISLLNYGYNVLIIDSFANSSIENLYRIKKINDLNFNKGKISFYEGDIKDTKRLESIFLEFEKKNDHIKSVIHFAGLKSVADSLIDPLRYWDENINATISLINVMKKFKCYELVFSSSATIYKPKLNLKLCEAAELGPINPYGNSKLSIEKLLKDISQSNPNLWRIANLRYFNPVGAHESGLIGEDPSIKANNLMPALIKVMKGEKKELLIFGNDWPTRDGTCIRDFIHVMDLADAHIAALIYLNKNKPQNIALNIGTGEGTSVLEIVSQFQKASQIDLPYTFKKRREGDAPYVVADNRFALKTLDWEPKRNIDEICIDTWRWIKNF